MNHIPRYGKKEGFWIKEAVKQEIFNELLQFHYANSHSYSVGIKRLGTI
jgi:hypothetical protein